jgi:hypothetical protein
VEGIEPHDVKVDVGHPQPGNSSRTSMRVVDRVRVAVSHLNSSMDVSCQGPRLTHMRDAS